MFPKAHIILGGIFSVLVLFIFKISFFQSLIIFFSSVLIDFDHYLWYVQRKKDFNLKNAYNFFKALRKHKPIMMFFHTIEFLLLILILSFFNDIFLFILIGLLFHSLFDIIDLTNRKLLSSREFSFIRYLIKKKDKNYYF